MPELNPNMSSESGIKHCDHPTKITKQLKKLSVTRRNVYAERESDSV